MADNEQSGAGNGAGASAPKTRKTKGETKRPLRQYHLFTETDSGRLDPVGPAQGYEGVNPSDAVGQHLKENNQDSGKFVIVPERNITRVVAETKSVQRTKLTASP